MMKWLRSHAHMGAALALLAMALQVFCTFGHIHISDASGFSSFKSAAIAKAPIAQAAVAAADPTSVMDGGALPPGADGDALCPLCLIGNLVASAIAPSAPLLALPAVYARFDPPQFAVDRDPVDVQTSFWSRGPPTS